MRTLILLALLSLSFTCFSQKSFYVKAGPAYSKIRKIDNDLGKSIGYYAGVGLNEKITDAIAVSIDLSFLNQMYSVNNISTATHSINFSFTAELYPGLSRFYFVIGPEFGHSIGYRLEGEKFDGQKDVRTNYIVGAGWEMSEKAGFQIRYSGALFNQQDGFLYNVQIGVRYKL